MKLAVCYGWNSPFIFTAFVDSVLNLQYPKGYEVRYFRGNGWCPAKRHINMCEAALDWGADLILIIGSDQLYPENMLQRLVDRFMEGYEIIAALVPCRGYVGWQPMKPFQPMAWRFRTNAPGDLKVHEYLGHDKTGDMLEVVVPEGGDVQKIHFIGSGVLMFHRDHILALKKPWFFETFDENYNRLACMDTTFVWRLQQEARADVWVDTTIKIKHAHVFHIDDTFQHRFTDWAEAGIGDPSICIGTNPQSTKSSL